MRRVTVTPYERAMLTVAVVSSVVGLLLLLLSEHAADHRFAMGMHMFSTGVLVTVLVLRAERAKHGQP